MENLHDIFNQYVETGKYPGVQWKIIQNNTINVGLVGYKNLEKKETKKLFNAKMINLIGDDILYYRKKKLSLFR